MFDFVEEHDFAISPLGVSGVLKGIKVLFEGMDCFVLFIDYFPYDSIGPAAYLFDNLISLQYMGFDFIVSFNH